MDIIEAREKEGMEFFIKINKASNKKGFFTKDEFIVDMDEGTVKCPAGHTEKIDKKKMKNRKTTTVRFGSKCENCPLQSQCTESKNGRQITIHKNEKKLQKEKVRQATNVKTLPAKNQRVRYN